MFKKAFTITELLIALGIIAILTAVLMPIIHSMVPNQNTLMAKRAFSTVETIVAGMINDNGCYPPTVIHVGFDDGNGYRRCPQWGEDSGKDPSLKFLAMFTDKLDLRGEIVNGQAGEVSFDTKDGMHWVFQNINFGGAGAVLTIDVDGVNKGPNCGNNNLSGECECPKIGYDGNCLKPRTKGFDSFTMNINSAGKIEILDCWAVKAISIDKKLTTDTSCLDD